MAEADLQLARFHLASLERLAFVDAVDPAALRKIRCLCWAAWHAVPDEECGEQLMTVEVRAGQLFGDAGERDWLRARICEALQAFEARLDEIEAMRQGFPATDGPAQRAGYSSASVAINTRGS